MRIVIRRREPGQWTVLRPTYGFQPPSLEAAGQFTVDVYPTWKDAMRAVLSVSLGGTGSFERAPRVFGVTDA